METKKIITGKEKEIIEVEDSDQNTNEELYIESISQTKQNNFNFSPDESSKKLPNYLVTRQWKQKLNQMNKITGKFIESEIEILKKALCQYVYEKNLGEEGLLKLVSENQRQITYGAWSEISKCLPLRSVQSCHAFCRRYFNPKNYGGKWTSEETAFLLQLVGEHGRQWTKIGEILQRTDMNVRDKFKSLGEEKIHDRSKFWTVQELAKLAKGVQKATGVKLITNRKGMWQAIKVKGNKLNEISFQLFSKQKRIMALNYTDPNLQFIVQYIDLEGLDKIKKEFIPWRIVMKNIITKTKDECRDKWKQQIVKLALQRKENLDTDQEDIKEEEEEDEEEEEEDRKRDNLKQDSDGDINLEKNDEGETDVINKTKKSPIQKTDSLNANEDVLRMLGFHAYQYRQRNQKNDQPNVSNTDKLLQFYREHYQSNGLLSSQEVESIIKQE